MSIRSIAIAVSIAALVALSAPAGAAGSTFVHHGSIYGFPSVYGFQSAQDFFVDLQAGDTISATLEWFDGVSDLDLILIPPAGSCPVLPTPDTACLVNSAAGRTQCPARPDGGLFLDTSGMETASYTVPVGGTWTISVQTSLALVDGEIPYVLSVDIAGAGDTSNIRMDPEMTNYLSASQHCRVL